MQHSSKMLHGPGSHLRGIIKMARLTQVRRAALAEAEKELKRQQEVEARAKMSCSIECSTCPTTLMAAKMLEVDPGQWNGERLEVHEACRTASCRITGKLGRVATCDVLVGLDVYATMFVEKGTVVQSIRHAPRAGTYEPRQRSVHPQGIAAQFSPWGSMKTTRR